MITLDKTLAATLAACAILNTACTLGPDYQRPAIDVPAAYKETSAAVAPEARDALPAGNWWALYGDEQLDQLIGQIETRNYSLQVIEARARQARSLAEMAEAARYPTLVAGGTNDLGLVANWEIDLWGRIRRDIEASGAAAQASTADLAATKLSLQAQLAQNYFLLRVRDTELSLLEESIAAQERSLQIAQNQYAAGVVDRAVVAQAQTQRGTTQVQMHDARAARAQLEHAIAVLVGKAPADFSIAVAPLNAHVPEVPSELPAELLQRRPDIAAAERRVAAASAKIGVAEAEFYPSLDLFGGVSIRKGLLGGAKVVAPLFVGNAAQIGRSRAAAAYEEAVANYRQTVLEGFREVEDTLVALQHLDQAAMAQDTAAAAASKTATITQNQYQAGLVSHPSVLSAQAAAVANQRAALNLLGRRLVSSATLIKALGGGWEPAATTRKKE
ncbi:MAG: RND transporter [Gallionellaceae bacterium CG11_big_fil_rev_8_21_14_0_20_60_62]|nr:MAG: RND transporter [Gallionellaceae bacterium CG11_big_fil_rev_8_21_14_0_20_60_62]